MEIWNWIMNNLCITLFLLLSFLQYCIQSTVDRPSYLLVATRMLGKIFGTKMNIAFSVGYLFLERTEIGNEK